ncbi:MAG: lactate racemase domain-containing protein, partial [Bellilinea sp.]
MISLTSPTVLTPEEIRQALSRALEGQFSRQRLLILIPDHTRSLPLPLLFRALVEILRDARRLDFMVALGTHPPLSEESLRRLVGITAEERRTVFAKIGLLNHAWQDPNTLAAIGTMERDEIQQLAGEYWHPTLPARVEIRLNKAALEYDCVLI